MDRCFYCKGDVKEDFTSYMVDLNGHFVIIKNVPCHKCTQCGEVSFSGKVVAKIETIIATLRAALTEVAIVDYSKAA